MKSGATVKGDTIEDVIKQLGLPSDTAETVKRYNELCAKGSDDDFHKGADHMHSLEQGRSTARAVVACWYSSPCSAV